MPTARSAGGARLARDHRGRRTAVACRLPPRAGPCADHRARGARPGAGGAAAPSPAACCAQREHERRRPAAADHLAAPRRGRGVGHRPARLPHRLEFADAARRRRTCRAAIRDMRVRGAPLIGATAAYGLALAMREDAVRRQRSSAPSATLQRDAARPRSTCAGRCERMRRALLRRCRRAQRARRRLRRGRRDRRRGRRSNCAPSADTACALLAGRRGAQAAARRSTCSRTATPAGWPRVDWGTALAPIYQAHDAGIAGARLGRRDPAAQPGRQPHRLGTGRSTACRTRVIADNAGGHLMQHGQVDLVHRRHRPRHRARRRLQQDRHLPQGAGGARQRRAVLRGAAVLDASTGRCDDGVRRDPDRGARGARGHARPRPRRRRRWSRCRSSPRQPGAQPGLRRDAGAAGDRLITERGVAAASREGLLALFPERAGS